MEEVSLEKMIEKYRREALNAQARSQSVWQDTAVQTMANSNADTDNDNDNDNDNGEDPPAEGLTENKADGQGVIGAGGRPLYAPAADNESAIFPEINPPEAGPGQDQLDELAPENVSYEDFLKLSPKSGLLRVQTFIAGQTIPIGGAQVVVSKSFTDQDRVFFEGITDENGIVDRITLPAPSGDLSKTPSTKPPYSVYTINVSHPDFQTEVYTQVPIFDGIKSIQPVQFRPLPGR